MATRSAWQDVHLFVSSTFRDTQAERDVLVRRVFPVLRAELLPHKVRLIDIDLRWGIEGKDESGVVAVCMEVLEQALPRFIGIIGDRYGWIPTGSEVSVTEQEIMAALNHSDCHPLFLLRNPARPEGSEALDFLDDTDAGADAPIKAFQLNRLRKQIEETSTARVQRYRCSISEGKVKPDAAFETQALEGLRESLRSVYTTDDVIMDAAPSDTVGHALGFASERAAEWLGGLRDDELTRVSDFLTSESGHIHILGAGGSGKTSLLAKALDGILEQSITDGRVVLAAFCGAHRGTESGDSVLRGMVDRLVDASVPATDDHDPSRPPTDFDELRKWFSRRIADTKAILIIDGIDQLPDRDRFLNWLPNPLPDGVTVLTGSLDSESTNRLSEHWKSRASDAITLAPINQHFGTNFVTNHLARYRKSLSLDALSTLMAKPGASTPLYLRIAAEELRTKGVRENLVNDIAGMPGTAGGMFLWVLKRLATDQQFRWSDGHSAIGALARCLGVARDGLSEAELVALLSTIDTKGQDPDGDTAVLLQLLRPYLGRRGDRYAPLHRVFSEALQGDGLTDADRSLLGSEHPAPLDELHEVQHAHAQLVSLFAGMPAGHLRRLSEEAWHCICSGDLDAACALLTDFAVLKSRVEAGLVRGVLEDMNALMHAASRATWLVPDDLRVWQRLFRRRREFWEQFPEEFHQDCLNEAEGLPTTESAKANPIDKPWIRWVNKPEQEIRHPWEWMVRDASCAAFSPDGKSVVVGGTDGSLRLLDAETGYEIWHVDGGSLVVRSAELKQYSARVLSTLLSPDIAQFRFAVRSPDSARVLSAASRLDSASIRFAVFSPDASRVLTATGDKTARLWDTWTGAELSVLRGHESWVESAAFSPDGTLVITASHDWTARVWDASTGSELCVLLGHENYVRSAVFSPDGTQVLTASHDTTARVWDASTWATLSVLHGHKDWVISAAFSRDGTRVLTASNDTTARLWDVSTGSELCVLLGHEKCVRSAIFSPDGTQVLTASQDATARVWDASTGATLFVLRVHGHWVSSAVFSPDGTQVLTASNDAPVRVWDASTGVEMSVLRWHETWVESAMFSPDGMLLLTTVDGSARLWETSSGLGLPVACGYHHRVFSLVFSPDGSRVLTASSDEAAHLWDTASGAEVSVLRGNSGRVQSAVFSPDGARVLTASSDETAHVWDALTGSKLSVLQGIVHWKEMFSPDGTRLLSVAYNKTVCVWDVSTGSKLFVLRGHRDAINSAVFSPDGALVLTASQDKTIRLWDASTGWEVSVLHGHEGSVQSAVFSPDGARVLTASSDKTVRIWDTTRRAELSVLRGHDDWVFSAVFSPDGTRVLTVSSETACFWDSETGESIGDPICNFTAIVSTQDMQAAVSLVSQREVLHRWSDGSPIPDSDPPVECPSRPTLIGSQGNLRHCLRVRGLSGFVPPWIHIDSPSVNDCVKVLPNDPLSFVAGCADGSVRFFRLEGVDLPANR
jgi:WD40 repeat protein